MKTIFTEEIIIGNGVEAMTRAKEMQERSQDARPRNEILTWWARGHWGHHRRTIPRAAFPPTYVQCIPRNPLTRGRRKRMKIPVYDRVVTIWSWEYNSPELNIRPAGLFDRPVERDERRRISEMDTIVEIKEMFTPRLLDGGSDWRTKTGCSKMKDVERAEGSFTKAKKDMRN